MLRRSAKNMTFEVIICLTIILAIIISSVFTKSDKQIKKELDDKLADNPKLSENDYFTEFFSDTNASKEVVAKIRNLFSEQLGHDLSALSADDDFSEDYSIIWDLDSLGDVELVLAIEETFSIDLSDAEAQSMTSIRKIVEIVTAKTSRASHTKDPAK